MEESKHFFSLFKRKIGIVVLGGIFLGALSFLFLVLSQKNFKVTTDFLILPSQTSGQDFYTLSKTSEYLSRVLEETIYSEFFVNKVVGTKKVSAEFLPFDRKARLKEWSRTIQVARNPQV